MAPITLQRDDQVDEWTFAASFGQNARFVAPTVKYLCLRLWNILPVLACFTAFVASRLGCHLTKWEKFLIDENSCCCRVAVCRKVRSYWKVWLRLERNARVPPGT